MDQLVLSITAKKFNNQFRSKNRKVIHPYLPETRQENEGKSQLSMFITKEIKVSKCKQMKKDIFKRFAKLITKIHICNTCDSFGLYNGNGQSFVKKISIYPNSEGLMIHVFFFLKVYRHFLKEIYSMGMLIGMEKF